MIKRWRGLIILVLSAVSMAASFISILCALNVIQAYEGTTTYINTTAIDDEWNLQTVETLVDWGTKDETRVVNGVTEVYKTADPVPKMLSSVSLSLFVPAIAVLLLMSTFWHFSMNGKFPKQMALINLATLLVVAILIPISLHILYEGVNIASTRTYKVSGSSDKVSEYLADKAVLPEFDQGKVAVIAITSRWPALGDYAYTAYSYNEWEDIIVHEDTLSNLSKGEVSKFFTQGLQWAYLAVLLQAIVVILRFLDDKGGRHC